MNARMELKRYTDANFQGYSAEESRPGQVSRPESWLGRLRSSNMYVLR